MLLVHVCFHTIMDMLGGGCRGARHTISLDTCSDAQGIGDLSPRNDTRYLGASRTGVRVLHALVSGGFTPHGRR